MVFFRDNNHFSLFSKILIFLVFSIPLTIILSSIIGESIPFSFDTARDFVQAASGKISLIGPPTGIPGIFYGPYWIWLIQLALFISHNPAHDTLIILVLPYFIILPVVLRKFTTIWGIQVSILVWLLFTLRFVSYFTSLWNPNLAPLLFWLLAYSAMRLGVVQKSKEYVLHTVFMGILVGLILNIHLSFGIGVALGTILYMISLKRLKGVGVFLLGLGVIYIPFIVFELRHGFGQIRAIMQTLQAAIWYSRSVVGHTGLHPIHIIDKFLRVIPSDILQMPRQVTTFFLITIGGWFGLQVLYKKIRLTQAQKSLVIFLLLCSVSILGVFLKSPNPVWEYHFIGVESIILLFFALIMRHLRIVRYLLTLWVFILTVGVLLNWSASRSVDPRISGSLAAKRFIIDSLYQDIGQGTSFAVSTYSPSIYTYDYDYLVTWYANSHKQLLPVTIDSAQTVYLIIQPTSKALFDDFIHYRTPDNQFETVNSWISPDTTSIIKRIRREAYE